MQTFKEKKNQASNKMGSGGLSNPPVPEVWEMCSLPEGGWGGDDG